MVLYTSNLVAACKFFDFFVPGAHCTDAQFRCGDGGCISLSLLCDFVAHCVDGSDESSCSKNVFVAQ